MARAGETIYLIIDVTDVDGDPVTGLVVGDLSTVCRFSGASYAPTLGLTEIAGGKYVLSVTLPSTAGSLSLTLATSTATDYVSPSDIYVEVERYDLDSIAAALTQVGASASGAVILADVSLGTTVDQDSWWSPVLSFDEDLLEQYGYTSDLSAQSGNLRASLRDAPGGTAYPISLVETDLSANQFQVGWNEAPYPTIGSEYARTYYADVQLIDDTGSPTVIYTLGRYYIDVLWQRETRTT